MTVRTRLKKSGTDRKRLLAGSARATVRQSAPGRTSLLAGATSRGRVPYLPLLNSDRLVLRSAGKAISVVAPRIVAATYVFTGPNAYFTLLNWQPNGMVRFRAVNLSGGDDVTSGWTNEGTVQGTLTIAGLMVPGETYRLYFQIDCVPDVPGWNESTWNDTATQWDQPERFDPPVSGTFGEA